MLWAMKSNPTSWLIIPVWVRLRNIILMLILFDEWPLGFITFGNVGFVS